MQSQKVNRTDSEKIFYSIKNVSGSSMAKNQGAVLACTGNSADGVNAVDPVDTSFMGWVGIVDADIVDTGYGRVQCWGYRDSVLLSHEGTSVTVTIGDVLHLVTGQAGLNTSTAEALSTMGSKYVVCLQTNELSAVAYVKGLIRCI